MITHDVSEAVFLSERIYVLSAHSGTIQREIEVNLGRDRTYDIRRTPKFYHYCEEIMDLLRDRAESPEGISR